MRYKVLPAWLVGGGGGTEFSLLASNGQKGAFLGVWGEFCTGAAESGLPGDFCETTGTAADRQFGGSDRQAGASRCH